MIVTHKINMNLDRAGVMPRVDVVQGDANTREIQFSLFSGGQAWEVPTDAQVLVRYKKANGAGGTYDTMSDGAAAAVVSGNTVTVTLAPQALSADGSVSLAVTLEKGDAELSTFAVQLNVMKNPTAATDDDGNYVSVSGLLPKPDSAEVGQYLEVAAVDQNGKIKELKAVDAPSGGVSDEQIANAVAEYMKANPSTVGASIYYTTVTLSDEMAESVYPFMYTDLVPSDRIPKVGDLIIDPKNRLYKIADVYGDPDFTADAAWVATLSKDGTGGSSVQPDWNQNDETAADHVKNRTHYEEGSQTVIEWDGNTEGRDSFTAGPGTFYKVSDLVPDSADVVNGTVEYYNDNEMSTFTLEEDFVGLGDGCVCCCELVVVVQKTECTFEDNVITAPSTGVYFLNDLVDKEMFRCSKLTYGSTTIHPLDEKFIPESIARKTATLPMPTTASVGQYIVVSAVDESGKVTATEAVTVTDIAEVSF